MARRQDIRQQEQAGEQRDPNRKWFKEYAESDLKHVLEVSHAHNWNDAIEYLDQKGMNDNELTPGETMSMREDLQKVAKSGSKFIQDPQQAYKLVHRGGAQQKSGSKAQSKKR